MLTLPLFAFGTFRFFALAFALADGSMLLCTQLEVGGEDTAVLNAVTNVLGNLPAALSPAVGIYLRRVTGSWVPFFGGASSSFCRAVWKRMTWHLETVLSLPAGSN